MEEQKAIKKAGAGAKFLAVILSLVLCVSIVVTLALFGFTRIVSKSGIRTLLEETFDMDFDVDKVLADSLGRELGIDVDDVFEDDELEDLYVDVTSDVLNAMITGDAKNFNSDKLVKFVEKHADDIEDVSGVKISKSDLKDLEEMLDESMEELVEEAQDDMERDSSLALVLKLFDKRIFFAAILADLVIIALIALIFRKNVDKTTIYTGVSSIIGGAVAAGFLKLMSVAMQDEDSFELINEIVVNPTIVAGIVVIVLGVALIVVGKIYRKSHVYA